MANPSLVTQQAARPHAAVQHELPFVNSARVWLVLVAFLALVELFITFVGAGLGCIFS